MATMRSTYIIHRTVRRLLLLLLLAGLTSAGAFGQAARKKSRVNGVSPDDYTKPQQIGGDSNPGLRYPAASFSGWSVKSTSYGWFDVSRNGIHYAVVQPADKISEGFTLSSTEITNLKIEETYLTFHRGAERKRYAIFYLSQDRWGTIHSGPAAMNAASVGALGTSSMFQSIRNFDNILAMVKPPAPVVAPAPVATPAPEPKPAAPPTPPAIVIASPPGVGENQTVETDASPLVVRGVAMDTTGIPVVSINGAPANMRSQTTQASEFWSDPLPLKAGTNAVVITASNSAHVQSRFEFTVHYAPRAAPVNPNALDKANIIALLAGGVPPSRVAEIVKQRGIKFTLGPDDVNEIRAAGGTDELIEALRSVAPHS